MVCMDRVGEVKLTVIVRIRANLSIGISGKRDVR